MATRIAGWMLASLRRQLAAIRGVRKPSPRKLRNANSNLVNRMSEKFYCDMCNQMTDHPLPACPGVNTSQDTPRNLDEYVAAIEQENARMKDLYTRLFMAASYVCHHDYSAGAPVGTRLIAIQDLREILEQKITT
jgi:hypothetical protein